MLGRKRVLCENSLNADSYSVLMESRKASMVFTDPPYNVPITGDATGLGVIQPREFKMASGEMSDAEFTDFLGQAFAQCLPQRHIGGGPANGVLCASLSISEIELDSRRVIVSKPRVWG